MQNVFRAGPESDVINGQLYPVAPFYAVQPGPAIGPMFGANSAAVPLATLPAGVSGQPAAAGARSMSTRYVTIGLALSFLLGVLILDRVHWR